GSVLHRSVSAPGNQARPQSPEDDDRKVRRREKNRVAAQRSRKKQTQKADKLHEEYECLEQENTVLRREIGKLTEELKHLSEALKEHEKEEASLHIRVPGSPLWSSGLDPRWPSLSVTLPLPAGTRLRSSSGARPESGWSRCASALAASTFPCRIISPSICIIKALSGLPWWPSG
uniref:Basic leucine zipper ATF-like transcription factor 3 n=1 Tax=Bos mutus grunniens TaxID=30521 RepID=A0A8B9YCV8_BOSMU